MEQENKMQFADGVLSIMELMLTAGEQLLAAHQRKEEGQLYFNDLLAGISALTDVYPQIKDELAHAYYMPMLVNISDTLLRVEKASAFADYEKILTLIQFQLIPFLQELREEFRFWCTVYPDKEKMAAYYSDEFVLSHANRYVDAEEMPYQVSIFIPVFNKLEYTRQCIESIYKNTDFNRHKCELILVNDGSTDGTEAYFDSLHVKKVIYFKENVKGSLFTTAFRVCEGEYFVFVNNDTVVTAGWLDNLMTCVESDERIISATPCTPNTSNFQVDIDKVYPRELSELSHFVNASNPDLWEERSRIMPVIALYRTRHLNKIGFADRLFYTLEFWDDDFSLRARRAGFRQMLCRDTYCYHAGSVTGKKDIEENDTMSLGEKLFYYKNGVPGHSVGYCYDRFIINCLEPICVRKSGEFRILGIDCGFGDTLLMLKNYFTKFGNDVIVDSMTLDERYFKDLAPITDRNIYTARMESGLNQFEPATYDLIYVSQKIESYGEVCEFFPLLHKLLAVEGALIFSFHNLLYAPNLSVCMKGGYPWREASVSFLNPILLTQEIRKVYSEQICVPVWGDEIAEELIGQISSAQEFVYYCTK